jgi:hypothetical protein
MITRSNIDRAIRTGRCEKAAILPQTNRNPSSLVAFAFAGLAYITLLSPAVAANPRPPGHTAPLKATIAACDRTAGCQYATNPKTGVTYGCSPTVCFACNTSQCTADVAKPRPGSHLPVGQVDGVKNILRRTTVMQRRTLAGGTVREANSVARKHSTDHFSGRKH